jgi:signal peptidase I
MTASEDEGADATGAEPTRRFDGVARDGAADRMSPDDEQLSGSLDEPASSPVAAPTKKPVKKGSFWKELPILIGIALVLTFLIQTFVARVYVIPSGSMEQTLNGCPGCTGDRILVDKLTYDFTDPHPGDVIVFKGPPGWAESEFNVQESHNVVVRWLRQFGSSIGIGSPPEYDLVKRVIAVGGQTVSCCDDNRVVVDGKPLDEPYIYWMPGFAHTQQTFDPVKIPPGDLWMMGDNRNNSLDSRFQAQGGIHGVVPEDDVIGIARTIIWPPGRWGGIGETNPQTTAQSLGGPNWPATLPPLGVGTLAAFPTLWLGRRTRDRLLRPRPPDDEAR